MVDCLPRFSGGDTSGVRAGFHGSIFCSTELHTSFLRNVPLGNQGFIVENLKGSNHYLERDNFMKPSPVLVPPTRKNEAFFLFPPPPLSRLMDWGFSFWAHGSFFGAVVWAPILSYTEAMMLSYTEPCISNERQFSLRHCVKKKGNLMFFPPKKKHAFFSHFFFLPFLRHVLIEARRTTTRSGTKHAQASVSHIIIMVGGGKNGAISSHKRKGKKRGKGWLLGLSSSYRGKKGRGEEDLYQMA